MGNEKFTIGYGKTQVTSHISNESPVYTGVIDALRTFKDTEGRLNPPECVSQITIRETYKGPRKMRNALGACSHFKGSLRSKIAIFAGNFDDLSDPRVAAQVVTHHEIYHALENSECCLSGIPHPQQGKHEEEKALKYSIQNYEDPNSPGIHNLGTKLIAFHSLHPPKKQPGTANLAHIEKVNTNKTPPREQKRSTNVGRGIVRSTK